MPRNPDLAPLLDGFGARLELRTRFFALTDSRLSRALLKLTALRALVGVRRIARLHIPGVNDSFFVGQTPDSAAAYRQHRLYSQASFAQAGRGGSDARVRGDLSGSEELYSSEAGGGVFLGITPAEFSLLTLESAAQVRHLECCLLSFLAPADTRIRCGRRRRFVKSSCREYGLTKHELTSALNGEVHPSRSFLWSPRHWSFSLRRMSACSRCVECNDCASACMLSHVLKWPNPCLRSYLLSLQQLQRCTLRSWRIPLTCDLARAT